MKMFARGIVMALFVCFAIWSAHGQAQDKSLKKIRWGVTALSSSNWIPWIAKDAKIYEQNGLDVEFCSEDRDRPRRRLSVGASSALR